MKSYAVKLNSLCYYLTGFCYSHTKIILIIFIHEGEWRTLSTVFDIVHVCGMYFTIQ
jgi:hypothetical protein